MDFSVRCYTLFDITQTNVANKRQPESTTPEWVYKRNTQCNYDTILQVISLRSQPEIIRPPEITEGSTRMFGIDYPKFGRFWYFDFSIQHESVFEDHTSTFGLLYNDCENVPMILTHNMYKDLPSFLNTTDSLKNIHFEIIDD